MSQVNSNLPADDSLTQIKEDFQDLLIGQFDEVDDALAAAIHATAAYAAQRAAHLSTLVGDPGFAEAVEAERNSVALFGGIAAVVEADALDAKVLGTIQGGLFFAARLLAVAL